MDNDFLQTLSRFGWSDHAAQAALQLGGPYPWGPNADAKWRNQRMRDWCSATLGRHKPPTEQASQLAFLNYEMRNTMLPIWQKTETAKTVEEAKEALSGYFGNLKGN